MDWKIVRGDGRSILYMNASSQCTCNGCVSRNTSDVLIIPFSRENFVTNRKSNQLKAFYIIRVFTKSYFRTHYNSVIFGPKMIVLTIA